MLARRIVGGAGLPELEPELRRRIVERLDRAERHDQALRNVGERELHLEAVVRHLQVPELVLQDDGHLLGILLLEPFGHRDALGARIKGDVQMVLAGQALALHPRQYLTHDAPQSILREKIVSDLVLCHERPPLRPFATLEAVTPLKWRASVARCPPKPRLTPAKGRGLDFQAIAPLTQREQPPHSCRWQLFGWPDNGGTMPGESASFTPSSILFRPLVQNPEIRSRKPEVQLGSILQSQRSG